MFRCLLRCPVGRAARGDNSFGEGRDAYMWAKWSAHPVSGNSVIFSSQST